MSSPHQHRGELMNFGGKNYGLTIAQGPVKILLFLYLLRNISDIKQYGKCSVPVLIFRDNTEQI